MPDKKTILLVEDEAIIAMANAKTIRSFGYEVIVADSGENAVTFFKENNSIDLILMDIDLGKGIDGTEAALAILKKRILPIVFLSSHTEPDIVEKTENITSYGYVVKNSGTTVLDISIKMAFKLFEANKKIAKSEIKHRAMIAGISDIISVIGADGKNQYVSSNIEKKFGWQPRDIIGTDILSTTHPDDRAHIQKEFNTLLMKDNASVETEARIICKDGSFRSMRISAANYTNDPIINGILCNFHDITERKRTDEAIRVSNEMLQKVLDNIPQTICWKDRLAF